MRISRRRLSGLTLVVGFVFVVLQAYRLSSRETDTTLEHRKTSNKRKNVLMIIADDLRPQLGVYHQHGMDKDVYYGMQTPNLDQLAKESLFFEKAFVQYAVCGPSRASALTSRRPSTTHVYNLKDYWRKKGGNFTTIPQYFKQHGYSTKGIGKVFHHGPSSGHNNDAISWTHPFFQPKTKMWHSKESTWQAVPESMRQQNPLPDDLVLDHALQSLDTLATDYKDTQTNFFLTVGFYRPHLPWLFPEEFLDHYPLEDVDYPLSPHLPDNVPEIALTDFTEMMTYGDINALNLTGDYTELMPYIQTKMLRRAYYASVSYIDHLIGQLLQAVKDASVEDDTIIAMWGDHGFLLGEHASWCKHSVFELATRIPMMLKIPKITNKGIVTKHVVELIDLFPTLAETAGLPALPPCPKNSRNVSVCTQGRSLRPLLADPNSLSWKDIALSEQGRFNGEIPVKGQSMRTRRFRYTEWPEWSGKLNWDKLVGVELYDLERDPSETKNLADHPAYQQVKKTLSAQLKNALVNGI